MTSAAANGHPTSLMAPNAGQRVEMDPNPIYEDEKTLRNSSSDGHGDRWSVGAVLKGDAGS
jgi:hypothetical protein